MGAQGLFISFEGVDGSGKSTQARLLAAHLRRAGREVIETREPGGSPGAEEIRALLLNGAADRWSAQTEILLFTAARRDHLERTIAPALARGAVVVCDRFADSTRVYQGAGDEALGALINRLHALMIGREPDLTFLLDIAPEAAVARIAARGAGEARFEGMGEGALAARVAAFRALAAAEPARWRVLNAARPEAVIAAEIAALAARAEAAAAPCPAFSPAAGPSTGTGTGTGTGTAIHPGTGPAP